MKTNKSQTNQNGKTLIFNTLALNSIIREQDSSLRSELKNIISEIVQGIRKTTRVECNNKSLELYLYKDGKEQYLRLYLNGDYTFLSDTFNY